MTSDTSVDLPPTYEKKDASPDVKDSTSDVKDAGADSSRDSSVSNKLGDEYVRALRSYMLRCNNEDIGPGDMHAIAVRLNLQAQLAGDVAFGRAVEACTAELASNLCGNPGEACDFSVYTGAGSVGDACEFASQCRSGACSAATRSCGSCIAPIAAGADCTAQPQGCGPGAYCERDFCVARSYRTLGQSCAAAGDVCERGLVCASDIAICIRPRSMHEPCARDSDCDQGGSYACGVISGGTARVCVRRPVAGESCLTTACATGLHCDASSKLCLSPRSDVAEGMLCGASDGCAPGTYCAAANREWRCTRLGASGDACSSDTFCVEGNDVCDSNGVCAAVRAHCAQ